MDIEEILGVFIGLALLALLVVTLYTGYRVYRLHQLGAPPEALAQEACRPLEVATSFAIEGLDLVLPSWGPTDTLLSFLREGGRFSVSLCQGIVAKFLGLRESPHKPAKITI